ncbi:MAG: maleylpyruvate isomerase family mycothiol-dependent enzyme [Actinomycetota bacterium]
MDVTRNQFDDLVGAFALDAVEPDEAAALEAYVARDDAAAGEAERLRAAAAWIGAIGASRPPANLRDRVLVSASERVGAVTPVEAYIAETDRLDDLLATLDNSVLHRTTHNGLTIRELVAHVDIIDGAFANELVEPTLPWIGAAEVERITRDALPSASAHSLTELRDRWRATRRHLADRAANADPDQRAAGYAPKDVLVIRAFEAWVHRDDILATLGRSPSPPAPAVLRSMAELAIRSLPAALAMRGVAHPGKSARIVLTGAGGGEWTIALAPGEDPGPVADVVMHAPVVELCRRFADRLTPESTPYRADGEVELARDVVRAAPAFAGL